MSTPAEPPFPSHAPDGEGGAAADALDGTERPAHAEGHALGCHRLGPHVVGQRVVVRRLLPGETGPTGGPAFTDTLGECLAWGPDTCTLRTGGTAANGRPARRGNSVLAMNPSGTPADDDVVVRTAAQVREHYVALGLPPLAQVVAGSPEEEALLDLGWSEAGGWAEAQVAPLARIQRYLPPPPAAAEVEVKEADESGPVVVARIGEDATVRMAVDDSATDPWACLADLWVAPARRRTGLARAVLAEAVDWAAAGGITTLHLQVELENEAALTLYRQVGFTAHHRYHYLTRD